MARKKAISERDKAIAWKNSKGPLTYDARGNPKPAGTAMCPLQFCKLEYRTLWFNDYGNQFDSSWVVNHVISLENGGSTDDSNLQAMHNYCKNLKRDIIVKK